MKRKHCALILIVALAATALGQSSGGSFQLSNSVVGAAVEQTAMADVAPAPAAEIFRSTAPSMRSWSVISPISLLSRYALVSGIRASETHPPRRMATFQVAFWTLTAIPSKAP